MRRKINLKPDGIISGALATIERIAEAMYEDDAIRVGKVCQWANAEPDAQECWIRRATVALLALLETKDP